MVPNLRSAAAQPDEFDGPRNLWLWSCVRLITRGFGTATLPDGIGGARLIVRDAAISKRWLLRRVWRMSVPKRDPRPATRRRGPRPRISGDDLVDRDRGDVPSLRTMPVRVSPDSTRESKETSGHREQITSTSRRLTPGDGPSPSSMRPMPSQAPPGPARRPVLCDRHDAWIRGRPQGRNHGPVNAKCSRWLVPNISS